MSIFNFWRKNKKNELEFSQKKSDENSDNKMLETNIKTEFNNGEFEFLIRGEIELDSENWEQILTPNSFKTEKILRNDWFYFKVDNDEFSYSFEEPGIQMTFNNEMDFKKAKKIADEVIEKIKSTGQNAELEILNKSKIYKFD
ncbi:hypothetical protein [Elizabethkingia anophelis]|uniref:hypothetical protein n=1 Tax=Elizabethkingia anophelis TaxID=1117645 RepID=UPI000442CED7|nr:hypothetical protein [Elizabethkingia anophelis]CDN75359.1 conserved hypothetical protein [Elizabethkingia anophelis]CDN79383.1 conserved hypothetical protein [Elizabethkingia anophelis]DAC76184.1 TPA_exp: hypothetical protein [Elizabethkingia anophelis]